MCDAKEAVKATKIDRLIEAMERLTAALSSG